MQVLILCLGSKYTSIVSYVQMPLKKLLMLVEMAVQGKESKGGNDGSQKIDINFFYDCLRDIS